MSLIRRAKRRDRNEAEIVAALRQIGVHVTPLDQPCDLLCMWRRTIFVLEVKDGTKPPSKGSNRISDVQAAFLAAAKLHRAPVAVCDSVDAALQYAQRVTGARPGPRRD